jgi:hypothetical protein
MWSNPMDLNAVVTADGVEVYTDNLRAFRLSLVGPLAALSGGSTVEVDGQPVSLGNAQAGDALCLQMAPDGWQVGDDDACAPAPPVVEAHETLRNGDLTPPYYDTPLGNWFCDSILYGTGAEIAFQNNGGIREPLEEGEITVDAIFRMNFRDELYTFELTGAQLVELLEFDLRDGKERPMQVAGLAYAFDLSRPEGRRVVEHDLDLQRTYAVAAEDYSVVRGERFFGREVEWTNTEVQIVDAQIRYAGEHGVVAPPLGRIRRVDEPR